MLDIITPSGDRPIQFSLCIEWMKRQKFDGKVHWIIVDDSIKEHYETPEMPFNWEVTHLKIKNKGLKRSSQPENVFLALNYVKYDNIVMIEDDDYYCPEWLEICNNNLLSYDISGRESVIQYNIKNRTYWDKSYLVKRTNAMAQTSFKSKYIPRLKEICVKHAEDFDPLLDHHLWCSVEENRKFFLKKDEKEYVVGIKGLPGRGGMSNKHDKLLFNFDYDFSFFKKIVGIEIASIYFKAFNIL